jgi:NADP-dependent 3-hydroxy acid dehydrogenase YdfG
MRSCDVAMHLRADFGDDGMPRGDRTMSELRFDGRTVIVTGAGRGIGRGHALLFASRGAKVVVADYGVDLDGSGSSSEPAEQVVKEIEAAGGDAVAVSADVSDEKAAASIVQAALDAYGRLDVLVNNAGIAAPLDTIENLTPANYRKMIEVHFLGTVYVTKAAWPHLVEGGYGRVVTRRPRPRSALCPRTRATDPPRARCSATPARWPSTGCVTEST